ncbi:hypothetical protein M413DRAFT_438023 [Hebeloma cylindrosporum]|uniref:Uncharacterized protein n=1 Tax=Hebeloma cylindrosporum TaxID=76867 RepID=A0A0C2YGL1_HEBCY|nr:hypothetical protein M413DRAFT_438023 [Hebeloma cylindrosporum h7]
MELKYFRVPALTFCLFGMGSFSGFCGNPEGHVNDDSFCPNILQVNGEYKTFAMQGSLWFIESQRSEDSASRIFTRANKYDWL